MDPMAYSGDHRGNEGSVPQVETETVTRTELSVLADIAEESDVIEEDEEAVIQNLLRLREMKVTEIMTPRVVITSVKATESVREVIERIPIMTHGRMPVYERMSMKW